MKINANKKSPPENVCNIFPFSQDAEASSSDEDADDVVDLDRETATGAMSDYFGAMTQELRETAVGEAEDWSRPLDVDANLLKNLLASYQSQDGSAGPATTLLEPLGIKLKKPS
jgi:hypothetical protein